MKRIALTTLLLAQVFVTSGLVQRTITWNTTTPEPGHNIAGQPTAQGAMPMGNGDVSALVWPNVTDGSLRISVGKSDALASDTSLYKLGLITVGVTPNPFGAFFSQQLDMDTATIIVKAGATEADATVFAAWVDANSNNVVVNVSSSHPMSTKVSVSSFRPSSPWSYAIPFFCGDATSQPDVREKVELNGKDAILLYHQNSEADGEFFESTLKQQGLSNLIPSLNNPVRNRTFGIAVTASDSAQWHTSSGGMSSKGVSGFELSVAAASGQYSSLDAFHTDLAKESAKLSPTSREQHVGWWSTFWNRSYVAINSSSTDPQDMGHVLTEAYTTTRYVQAVQARGEWPIKFNGMAFGSVLGVDNGNGGPDWRDWGPSNWWQNTRLPYWNMFASGDWELLPSLLDYYSRMLPFAQGRTQTYFNHSGIFFTETKTVFGAFSPQDYGCSRPDDYPVWLETNEYIHLDYAGDGGTTEVAMMVLDLYEYTGDVALLAKYFPLADLAARFFIDHYPRDANNTIRIFPTQALETYWCAYPYNESNCCVNDAPAVAALHALLPRLIQLPPHFATPDKVAYWSEALQHLPRLPQADGKLLSAEILSPGIHNSETPELYAVHPYRLFTKAAALASGVDTSPAVASWQTDPLAHSNTGWTQGGMNAALLGLTENATSMLIARATASPARGYRFKGFAQHFQDYEPSADHYANYNSALQYMLLQSADDANCTTALLPAWPCDWDVDFKLYAPCATTIEGTLRDGSFHYTVTPDSRKAFVKPVSCV